MSLRAMIENPPTLSELTSWRKFVLVVAVAFGLLVAAIAVDKHLTIYSSAPDHPVPSEGRTYKVSVMHGYVRYVTLRDQESVLLWTGRAGSWVGAVTVVAFFLWITAPRKAPRKLVAPLRGPPHT
jgi:hypothetical protein